LGADRRTGPRRAARRHRRMDVLVGRLDRRPARQGFGDSRLDLFELERNGDELALSWRSEGSYPFPFERIALRLHGAVARGLAIDGREVVPDGEPVEAGPFDRAVLLL
jgi:hypothetical protein